MLCVCLINVRLCGVVCGGVCGNDLVCFAAIATCYHKKVFHLKKSEEHWMNHFWRTGFSLAESRFWHPFFCRVEH